MPDHSVRQIATRSSFHGRITGDDFNAISGRSHAQAKIEESRTNQTRKDHAGVAAAARKRAGDETLLDCPLCERPHSQFATIAELAKGLGWQVLHQCPDGRAQSVGGETHEKAVEAWNFYCERERRR